MSVRLYDKFQSRCSFIVTPRYLTCVVHEIYWLLILKFRCFIIFLKDLILNIKISEYQHSRIIMAFPIGCQYDIWLQNDSLLIIIDHYFAPRTFKRCKHRMCRTRLEEWVGRGTELMWLFGYPKFSL